MSSLNAFFIQYQVNRKNVAKGQTVRSQGIATIIVFADNEYIAKSRAGRMIIAKKLEVTDFLRIHLVRKSYVEILDNVLKSLYTQAELYGIAIHCDLFSTNTICCNQRHDDPD